jgi:predicted outer membrane repeat protein
MRGFTGGFAAALLALGLAQGASAATLEVTKTGDPAPGGCTAGDCSLREAVLRANSTAADDRIVLGSRKYALTQAGFDNEGLLGDLDVLGVSGELAITGRGAGRTTVTGNTGDRLLEVHDGGRAVVRGLALTGGEQGAGGAIYTDGNSRLRVTESRVSGNTAGFGGALYLNEESRVTLTKTLFRGNTADGIGGGAIYNQNEAVLTIRKSRFEGNRAIGGVEGGGAILNQNEATARIFDSTISGNASAAAGGGIYAKNQSSLSTLNTTISGNSADEGGGIYFWQQARVELTFTTVADNLALSAGGAIFDAGEPPGPPAPPYMTLDATLIADNRGPQGRNCFVDSNDNWRSNGFNVEDRNTCPLTAASDDGNAKPGLRDLGRNGGPTKTHALKPSSEAVNAVPKRGCPKRDQRGVKRPQGRRCDAGSYELKRR